VGVNVSVGVNVIVGVTVRVAVPITVPGGKVIVADEIQTGLILVSIIWEGVIVGFVLPRELNVKTIIPKQ
jgi:hypothetical protein